jgi:hypothetical protein
MNEEPEYLSRYSDGIRTDRPGLDSAQRQRIFLYSAAFTQVLVSIQPRILWELWLIPGFKGAGA